MFGRIQLTISTAKILPTDSRIYWANSHPDADPSTDACTNGIHTESNKILYMSEVSSSSLQHHVRWEYSGKCSFQIFKGVKLLVLF